MDKPTPIGPMLSENWMVDEEQQNGVNDTTKDEEVERREVEAAEKVINALSFYKKYATAKLKRQADSILWVLIKV